MLINKIKLSYLVYGDHKANRSIHNEVEVEHNKKATAVIGIILITLKCGWKWAQFQQTANLAVEDIEPGKNQLLVLLAWIAAGSLEFLMH